MSTAFKRVWREVALLRRYVGDVVKQWKVILGSAVIVSALWIAGHYRASLLAPLVPFLPDTVEPWLTRNRLMVISVFFILATGQYLVWRKLGLAADREQPEQPEIDDRLELLEEFGGLRPPDIEAEIREMNSLSLQPDPDHMDTISLRAKREIEPPLLDIRCTGPIYSVTCVYLPPEAELIMSMEPVRRGPDRILMRLGEKPLPVGTAVFLKLFSPVPIRLKRIAIGRQR